MGSTRLPGKVMMDYDGVPLISRVLHSVDRATVDSIVLATTDLSFDDVLEEYCGTLILLHPLSVFRGSESDVLDRYYQSAKASGADIIVRVTGDCPFVSSDIINMCVKTLKNSGSSCVYFDGVDGLDVEVFTFDILEFAWKHATSEYDREHVCPFIKEKGHDVHRLSDYKLSVDTVLDYEYCCSLFTRY